MCHKPQRDNPDSCVVALRARSHPEAPAFVVSDREYTYRAWDNEITARQESLASQGVSRGDRVLLVVTPSVSCCATFWALVRLGATVCPVNPALPEKARDRAVNILEPHWMLDADGEASLRRTLTTGPPPVRFDVTPNEAAFVPCTMVLTSGSSGPPKAVVHTLSNHIAAATAANRNMALGPGDRWILSLPLFHVAGLAVLFRCVVGGAAVVAPAPGASLETTLIAAHATHVSLVPTQLHRLLASPDALLALRSMKGVLLGGAPAPEELIRRAVAANIPLVRSYGMTETTAQLCATTPGADERDLYASGRPLVADTVRIAADGMVEVRGDTLFAGYYGGAGSFQRPETADGWFRTGDRGYFDDAGRLHISGRFDTMFTRGGENIHPEEIEAALCSLPGVCRAMVVPVPDAEYGAAPVAFVDMPEHDLVKERDVLHEKLASLLPRFKLPRRFLAWPASVPEGMKPDRAAFAALARTSDPDNHPQDYS